MQGRPIPSRKRRRKRPSDDILRQVIESKAGLVRPIAEALDVAPRTVREWREKSRKVAAMFAEVREATCDLAESKLLAGIRAGNMTAVLFYLKCQAKGRGYVERQELTGADGEPLAATREHVRRETDRVRAMLADPEALLLQRRLVRRLAGLPELPDEVPPELH